MAFRSSKRALALALAAALTFPAAAWASESSTMPAITPAKPMAEAPGSLAQVKLSEAEAVAAVRAVLTIPESMGQPNVNLSQSQNYAVYSLNWQTSNRQPDRIQINVEVDAISGVIRSYSRWSTSPDSQGELRYTRSEAEKLAQQWLDKLAGDLKSSLDYVDNPLSSWYYGGSASYDFTWTRMVQGYPFGGESVRISIDARTGELGGFHRSGPDQGITFTKPETLLTAAEAEALYRSQVPMALRYQQFHKPGTDISEWRLVFQPRHGYPYVTQDGKLLNSQGKEVDFNRLQGEKVPASEKPYVAPVSSLSQDEALALAQAVVGRTDQPTSVFFSTYGEEEKTRSYEFSWYKEGELAENEFNSSVRIDADRGIVISFHQYGRMSYEPLKEGEAPKLTEAQARQLAVDFIQKHRPDLAGSVMLEPSDRELYEIKLGPNPANYYIRYTHLKNDIPVQYNGGSFDVDARTGTIRSFWGDSFNSKSEFPAPEGLVSAADALEAFLKHQGLELGWVIFYDYSTTTGEPNRSQPQLVYMPARSLAVGMVDAKSGAPIDYQGRDLLEAMKRPTDIEGHPAQREIELLWARGVFELKDGLFNPDQEVTAAEFARWLVLSRGMQPYVAYDFRGALGAGNAKLAMALESSADNAYFGAAFQSGILLPEDFGEDATLDSSVTREQAALWAVRAMGYGSIAKMENRIAMPFADSEAIGARYANAVALLNGLGVVKGGAEVTYRPQAAITRGEAARMIFAVTSEVRR